MSDLNYQVISVSECSAVLIVKMVAKMRLTAGPHLTHEAYVLAR